MGQSGVDHLLLGRPVTECRKTGKINQTNVQLCSSQVDKGKSDRFSEKFVCAKKILCENFFG